MGGCLLFSSVILQDLFVKFLGKTDLWDWLALDDSYVR